MGKRGKAAKPVVLDHYEELIEQEEIEIAGTIQDCETTDYGWRGVMPDGFVIEVRYRSGLIPAIPDCDCVTIEGKNYLLARKSGL